MRLLFREHGKIYLVSSNEFVEGERERREGEGEGRRGREKRGDREGRRRRRREFGYAGFVQNYADSTL